MKKIGLESLAIRVEPAIPDIAVNSISEPRYKRPFDITVLVLAHLLLAPLWLILWISIPLAIKLDDGGPVFYTQERVGRGRKRFKVRKFRSMITDAENGTGAVWASRNDPRITRVGRFLRHTALDELPQVLNVWAGDMSLVGPRPERPQLHAQFTSETPEFENRLLVRPGMAGMAQVYGDYDLSPRFKLEYDLKYVQSMGIFMDAKLLTMAAFNTIFARWGHATGDTTAPTVESLSTDTSASTNVVPFTLAANSPKTTEETDDRDEEVDAAA